MRRASLLAGLCLTVSLSGLALAQPAGAPKPIPGAPSAPVPDAATVKAARDVVAQMQGDRGATLNAISAPLAGMMQQMGVKEPERAQVLVREVVIPLLTAHYDDLLDVQARSFAAALGKDDLQAIGAFYATPAGKRLVAAQPQLAQAQVTGMSQWMSGLLSELQGKLATAIKAHGWDKPAAK